MKKKLPNKEYISSITHQKLIEVNPRGFCHGVVNSYVTAKKYLKKKLPNERVYMLGRIVHNDFIVDELKKDGLIFVEDIGRKREDLIKELDDGVTVIFSAHGTSPVAFRIAKLKNIKIIDTTCDRVYVTHDIVKSKLRENKRILFVGTKNHPETLSIKGIAEDKIDLIYTIDDIKQIHFLKNQEYFVTNQTTLSILDVKNIFNKLKDILKDQLEIQNDICYATFDRQTAILDLKDDNVELVIIVGDKKSNNSKRLAQVGNEISKESILIQSVDNFDNELTKKVKNSKVIVLSSGASTPTQVTKAVSNKIKELCQIT